MYHEHRGVSLVLHHGSDTWCRLTHLCELSHLALYSEWVQSSCAPSLSHPLCHADSSSASKTTGKALRDTGSLYEKFSKLKVDNKPLLVDSAAEFGFRGTRSHCLFKRADLDKVVGCSTVGKCAFRLISKTPTLMRTWCCDTNHAEDDPSHDFPDGAYEKVRAMWEPAYVKHQAERETFNKPSPQKKPRK